MYYSIPVKYSIVVGIIVFFIELFLCVFMGKYYFRGWHKAEFGDIIFHLITTIYLIYCYNKLKNVKSDKNYHFFALKQKKQPKKQKGEKVKFDKSKNKLNLKNIKFKNKNQVNIDENKNNK